MRIYKNAEEKRMKRRDRSIKWIMIILIVLSILNIMSVAFYKEDLFSVKKYMLIVFMSSMISLFFMYFNYTIYRKNFMKGLIFGVL